MGFKRRIERTAKKILVNSMCSLLRTPHVGASEILASSPKRILVIRQHNQMGDMLLAEPAIRALRRSFPEAEIGVVTSQINREVLENNPSIDELYCYRKKNPISHIGLVGGIRRRKFDLVIVLHTVSFSLTSILLALLSGARYRAGSVSHPFGHRLSTAAFHLELPLPSQEELSRMNETEHNLYPLAALGVEAGDLCPRIHPGRSDEIRAEELVSRHGRGKTMLCVHPGAGKRKNIYPPDKLGRTVENLAKKLPLFVFVLEGPRDGDAVAGFMTSCSVPSAIVRGRRIGEVAALMKRTALVLCNDTGIMHVAAAAGATTLALFGPTDPARWAPRCPNLHAMRAPGGELERLDPDAVERRAMELLGLERGA